MQRSECRRILGDDGAYLPATHAVSGESFMASVKLSVDGKNVKLSGVGKSVRLTKAHPH
jgi:hypothetical protein